MNFHNLDLQSNNFTISNNKKDTIDKFYESCGCIQISELDILQNIIIEKYIQLCKLHYRSYNKINNKSKFSNKTNYIFDKKLNKYIISNHNKHKLLKSKSYENVQGSLLKYIYKKSYSNPIDYGNNNNLDNLNLLNFGKYKNKTYEYVYYTDKVYCYNLAFWKNNEFKNKKILNFIKFIKKQLLLEYN